MVTFLVRFFSFRSIASDILQIESYLKTLSIVALGILLFPLFPVKHARILDFETLALKLWLNHVRFVNRRRGARNTNGECSQCYWLKLVHSNSWPIQAGMFDGKKRRHAWESRPTSHFTRLAQWQSKRMITVRRKFDSFIAYQKSLILDQL